QVRHSPTILLWQPSRPSGLPGRRSGPDLPGSVTRRCGAGRGRRGRTRAARHAPGTPGGRRPRRSPNPRRPPAPPPPRRGAPAPAADGPDPLLARARALAQRARFPLQAPPAAVPEKPPPVAVATYGLTGRELAVLRLLAAGRTNAQIGAELYISPKTASVHVT